MTPAGVLVAEGLPGKDGADGSNGAAEIGAGFAILQGAGTARVMACWGSVTSNRDDYVRVVFPRSFSAPPVMVVSDAIKSTFATESAFVWHLRAVPDVAGADVQCIAVNGGGLDNAPQSGRVGCWIAWGAVA